MPSRSSYGPDAFAFDPANMSSSGAQPLVYYPSTHPTLVVELKYGRGRERVLSGLKRVSKPGRRIYAGKDRRQRVLGGMGIAIMSTSRGVVTSRTAEAEGIGGEVLCYVW